ncbi:MAG: hypothetical protein F4Z82_20455 [Caldilineaceae bacterium SB0668_bin_21]|nr:hypothetical protein [Caldilineaceae bacterium SB0668_bin_21]MYC22856.1 hypothetical protein [Caldilineaceae bacterium SB0662_bin_25]
MSEDTEAAVPVWDDIARWDDGSGRLTAQRSKADTTPRAIYLTPVARAHLDANRSDGAVGPAWLSIFFSDRDGC